MPPPQYPPQPPVATPDKSGPNEPDPMSISGQSASPQQPRRAPRLNKRLLLIIAATAVVLIVGAVVFWPRSRPAPKQPATVPPTTTAVIDSVASESLTAADVAKLDKTEAFFGYFLTTAQQQKAVVTTEELSADSPDKIKSTDKMVYKAGFDYQTKQSVFAWDTTSGTSTSQERCMDGTYALRSSSASDWSQRSIPADAPCTIGSTLDYYISDGFNTGGLSADQAQKFVSYLRARSGLISVTNVQLATHSGKQYLHFSVDLTPISAGGKDAATYFGMQWLLFAFKQTGLDPLTYPFAYRGQGGAGLHAEYYIDPATKLPVYSEIETTPTKDASGKNEPYSSYNRDRISYQFGTATFDASVQNDAPLTVDW